MYTANYLIEIDKPSAEDMDILLSGIDEFNDRGHFMLPCLNKNDAKMSIVLVLSEKHTASRMKEALSRVFGRPTPYTPLDLCAATEEQRTAVQTGKRLLTKSTCYGNLNIRFTNKSTEECQKDIEDLIGFGSFKTACEQMRLYHDNAKRLNKKANYNAALVLDCKTDTDLFVELIYDLYASLGVITDPYIATGDLGDAVGSGRDTAHLFVIEERWNLHDAECLVDTGLDKSFAKLCKRGTVYVTVCDRRQYEQLIQTESFSRLFPQSIEIGEINKLEMLEFLKREAAGYGFALDENSFENSALLDCNLEHLRAQISVAVKRKLTGRLFDTTLKASDFEMQKRPAKKSAFDELESLIGLDGVKNCVREISAFLQRRGRDALPCLHMVFRGNPGTGKTTVARLIGRIFGETGILKRPDLFVEADRNTLVSKYIGGTASQTAGTVERALGGVLFIDEAYALNNGERYDYGNEAVAVLVKQMEDYRKDFVCIMAGYTNEMNNMLNMNPGLRERVQFYIDFPDYSPEELAAIFCALCKAEKYNMTGKAKTLLNEYFTKIVKYKDENFANGRIARKIFERIRLKQALRTAGNTIAAGDVEAAFAEDDLSALCSKNKAKTSIGFSA